MVLYDVIDFTPTNFMIKNEVNTHSSYAIKQEATESGVLTSNTNISQKSNGVNSIISENAENDTDIQQMNTGEDTDNEIIDRYTEKQYNNFGWIAVNQVLTKNEWSQYNNKLRKRFQSKYLEISTANM